MKFEVKNKSFSVAIEIYSNVICECYAKTAQYTIFWKILFININSGGKKTFLPYIPIRSLLILSRIQPEKKKFRKILQKSFFFFNRLINSTCTLFIIIFTVIKKYLVRSKVLVEVENILVVNTVATLKRCV